MTANPCRRNVETARSGPRKRILAVLTLLAIGLPAPAHASIFEGETLDKVAEILAWIVLVIAPVVGITAFWLVHILPEKIAEKKHHPQAKAIQVLCLLSLAFGGLLWPLAWLWAYSKPVLYKMAYGTDVHEEPGSGGATTAHEPAAVTGPSELERLRARVAELEAKLIARPAGSGA
jgi:hypothetical protein